MCPTVTRSDDACLSTSCDSDRVIIDDNETKCKNGETLYVVSSPDQSLSSMYFHRGRRARQTLRLKTNLLARMENGSERIRKEMNSLLKQISSLHATPLARIRVLAIVAFQEIANPLIPVIKRSSANHLRTTSYLW